MLKKIFTVTVFSCFTLLTSDAFSQGCSQCKLVASQGSELSEDSFGTNINWGILYLMIIPYILLMVFFRKPIVRFLKKVFKKA